MGSNKSLTEEASAKGTSVRNAMDRVAREERWEEVDLLLDAGESPEGVVRRTGIPPAALSAQAYRASLTDPENRESWLAKARLFNNLRTRKSRAKPR